MLFVPTNKETFEGPVTTQNFDLDYSMAAHVAYTKDNFPNFAKKYDL